MPYEEEDEFQGAGTGDWLAGIGSGAASGAVAGSSFGPWGAVIGGAAGGLFGAGRTYLGDQAAYEEWERQQALQAELDAVGTDFDTYLASQALAGSIQSRRAAQQAREAAARGGLTEAAGIALEQQAVADVNRAQQAGRASSFVAAKQANLAERQQILDEFQGAQGLADGSAGSTAAMDLAWGGLTEGASQLGSMQGGAGAGDAAAAKTDPGSSVSHDAAQTGARAFTGGPTSLGSGWQREAEQFGDLGVSPGSAEFRPFGFESRAAPVGPGLGPELGGASGAAGLPQAPVAGSQGGIPAVGPSQPGAPSGAPGAPGEPSVWDAIQPPEVGQGPQIQSGDDYVAQELANGRYVGVDEIRSIQDSALKSQAIDRLAGLA
jgi:hypothetical protein